MQWSLRCQGFRYCPDVSVRYTHGSRSKREPEQLSVHVSSILWRCNAARRTSHSSELSFDTDQRDEYRGLSPKGYSFHIYHKRLSPFDEIRLELKLQHGYDLLLRKKEQHHSGIADQSGLHAVALRNYLQELFFQELPHFL